MKLTNWLGELGTNILGNVLTPIVLVLVGVVAGGAYALYSSNPQVALLVLFAIIVAANTLANLFWLRQQRITFKILQETEKRLDNAERKLDQLLKSNRTRSEEPIIKPRQ